MFSLSRKGVPPGVLAPAIPPLGVGMLRVGVPPTKTTAYIQCSKHTQNMHTIHGMVVTAFQIIPGGCVGGEGGAGIDIFT